jgi:uncharacterized protein (TIGR02391 family)
MRELLKQFPDPAMLSRLTREELAQSVLAAMQQRCKDPIGGMANRDGSVAELFSVSNQWGRTVMLEHQLKKSLAKELQVAFNLLEEWGFAEAAEGLNGKNGFMELTPEGRNAVSTINVESVMQRSHLVDSMLHRLLRESVASDFRGGRFNDSIFGAFKVLEMEIQTAACLTQTEHGSELLRRAFNPENGPLTDMTEKRSHRESLQKLFEGAFGRFRNVDAHGNRTFSDAFEPMQELMFVSRLLAIVDSRRK